MKLNVLLGLFLLCLVVGCSKSGDSSSGPKNTDLGVVNLKYGEDSKHDIGNGYSCVLVASQFHPGECELIATLEKSGKTLETRRQLPAMLDKPAKFSFDQFELSVTPHIGQ
jgi:hypothetical protein